MTLTEKLNKFANQLLYYNLNRYKNSYKINYIKYVIKKCISKSVIKSYIKTNPNKLYEIAFIYHYYYNNQKQMITYYKYAITKLNNTNAMISLGSYYERIGNLHMATLYYENAIKYDNNPLAMLYLAKINSNPIKYYNMAIKQNYLYAFYCFGKYYEECMDYDRMKIYYQLASLLNDSDAMCELGNFYKFQEIDKDKMNKFYSMSAELNNMHAIHEIYYNTKTLINKYNMIGLKLNDKRTINLFINYYKYY